MGPQAPAAIRTAPDRGQRADDRPDAARRREPGHGHELADGRCVGRTRSDHRPPDGASAGARRKDPRNHPVRTARKKPGAGRENKQRAVGRRTARGRRDDDEPQRTLENPRKRAATRLDVPHRGASRRMPGNRSRHDNRPTADTSSGPAADGGIVPPEIHPHTLTAQQRQRRRPPAPAAVCAGSPKSSAGSPGQPERTRHHALTHSRSIASAGAPAADGAPAPIPA